MAVELLAEADEAAEQLRTVTGGDLRRWGRSTGLPFEVHERHGDGWLVVEGA